MSKYVPGYNTPAEYIVNLFEIRVYLQRMKEY